MSDRVPETIGELGVILVRVERQLEQLVTKSTFEAEQQRTREEFRAVRGDQTQWATESRGAHQHLDTKIDAVKNELTIKIETIEKAQTVAAQEQQRTRSSRWFQVAMAVVVGLLGFGLGLLQVVVTGGS